MSSTAILSELGTAWYLSEVSGLRIVEGLWLQPETQAVLNYYGHFWSPGSPPLDATTAVEVFSLKILIDNSPCIC